MQKCLNCGQETKNKKFCSSSCSAKINNTSRKNRMKGICKNCGEATNKCRVNCNKCKNSHNTITDNCLICGVLKTVENAIPEKGYKFRAYCRECHLEYESFRRRQNKQIYINYKGGCCQICGYNKSSSALQFHHIDPTQKEFEISSKNKPGLDEERIKELDKCILLCANCHAEEHFERNIKQIVIDYYFSHLKNGNKSNT